MKNIVNVILYKWPPGEELVVLLQKKWDHPLHGNRWCIFGGHRKRRESLEGAAGREIKHELGIKIGLLGKLGVYVFNNFGGLKYHVFYHPLVYRLSKLSLGEGGGFALLSEKEIKKLPLIGNDRKILEKFFSFMAQSH